MMLKFVEEFENLKKNTDKVLAPEDTGILLDAATRQEEVINVSINSVDVLVSSVEQVSIETLIKEQLEDKVTGEVYKMVQNDVKNVGAKELKKLSKDVKVLLRQLD